MSAKYARIMHSQGRESHIRLGGKLWTTSGRTGCRELSEVREFAGGRAYLTGMWSGMGRYGFHSLAEAGAYRRLAMAQRDDFRRRVLLRRAYEALERAREFDAPVLERVSVEVRRAA